MSAGADGGVGGGVVERSGAQRYLARPVLRDVIVAHGRRMDWLARLLGVSGAQVSRIVAGQNSASVATARVLATVLGQEIGALFDLLDGDDSLHERKTLTPEQDGAG